MTTTYRNQLANILDGRDILDSRDEAAAAVLIKAQVHILEDADTPPTSAETVGRTAVELAKYGIPGPALPIAVHRTVRLSAQTGLSLDGMIDLMGEGTATFAQATPRQIIRLAAYIQKVYRAV